MACVAPVKFGEIDAAVIVGFLVHRVIYFAQVDDNNRLFALHRASRNSEITAGKQRDNSAGPAGPSGTYARASSRMTRTRKRSGAIG